MAAEIERHGIPTSVEISGANIADKLLQNVASSRSVVLGRAEIGAWSKV
jgi:hypothetical protein